MRISDWSSDVCSSDLPGMLSTTSTEAVNGAQLFGMGDSMAQFLGGGASMGAQGFSGPTYLIQGGSYYNVGDALGAIDGAISGIDSRLRRSEARRVGKECVSTCRSRW